VIGSAGALGGFSGGIEMKKKLLVLEGQGKGCQRRPKYR